MTDNNATPANNPTRENLSDLQADAVVLHGLLEAIDHLDNEGHHNALHAVIATAKKAADKLANDLDRVAS